MHVVASIISTLVVILVIGYLWFCADNLLNMRSFKIGYTGSDLHLCLPALRRVIEKYDIHPSTSVFVEAGAGFARLSRTMAKEYKWKDMIAIEIRWLTLAVARFLNLRQRAPIHFLRRNALTFRYPTGSFIYSYLSTALLERLYLENKLAGCFVVSLTFSIPGVTPTEEIRLQGWQQHMWVYDFRAKN